MPELDALISEYSHLKHYPREKEALHTLKKIASLVKPVMRARGWTVGTLAEFYPDQHNLLGANVFPLCLMYGARADRNQESIRIEARKYAFDCGILETRTSFFP